MIFLALFLIWLAWAIGDTIRCDRAFNRRRRKYFDYWSWVEIGPNGGVTSVTIINPGSGYFP